MTNQSDGHLLRAFRSGDRGAFTALVTRHESALLRHARALLGEGSAYEDVVQEVFLKLAQVPPEVPPECNGDVELERLHLTAWLHKVTRNACMDVMRSEARRKKREHDVANDDAQAGDFGAVELGDTRAAVRRELAKLPVDQREVLVLRLLDERSYKEIAEITGKKIGTVGWLISVGLKELGTRLEPLMSGEKRPGAGLDRAGSPMRLDVVQGELS
ncbi:MAG: RNA polymerase sigma factor [Planctomycetes bacterium]|nr:RNA polymerase sigma factor [Planctomycetota bacterium]